MLRVAPNDPGLAHGGARFAIAELADRVKDLELRLNGLQIKHASRLLHQYYGPMMLAEDIVRATGSRARASWVVLDSDGDVLVALLIRRWNQGNFARLVADRYRSVYGGRARSTVPAHGRRRRPAMRWRRCSPSTSRRRPRRRWPASSPVNV